MNISTRTQISIRPYQPEDEARVIEICHLTGNREVDPYLFALRWCLDYVWHEPENCFVALDEDQRVVGYILGAEDTAAQEERFAKKMLPKMKAYWKTMQPKTLRKLKDYLFLRMNLGHGFDYLLPLYPAHLHINVDPDCQRSGVGGELIAAYEENMRRKGVGGYHLVVDAENRAGVSFYRKQGLVVVGEFPKRGKPLALAFGRLL